MASKPTTGGTKLDFALSRAKLDPNYSPVGATRRPEPLLGRVDSLQQSPSDPSTTRLAAEVQDLINLVNRY